MEGRDSPSYRPDIYSQASPSTAQPRQRISRSPSSPVDVAGNGIFYQSSWVGMDEYAVKTRSSHTLWRLFRWILMVVVLVWWVAMFIACIVMLAQGSSGHCPGGEATRWYDVAIGYQIYPASFQDSDGDGVGDIRGIISRLEYLEVLGVDTIWLGPIFQSLGVDLWMDVTDFTAVDGVYGTTQDFEDLVAAIHNKNMKLILEFIPNHSSDQHPWFQDSRQAPDNDYSDYYIWADGSDGGSPRYTASGADGASSWEYDATRRQWYLYSFIKEEPDLNYRNPGVIRDVQVALRFWLDKGVDGFYMRHTDRLFEPGIQMGSFSNNQEGNGVTSSEDSVILEARNKTLDVITGWRQLLDEYEASNETQDNSKLLVVDTGSDLALAAFVYNNKSLEVRRADFPFNFMFLTMARPLNGHQLRAATEDWITAGPIDGSRIWALMGHGSIQLDYPYKDTEKLRKFDVSRIASRYGERFTRAMLFLMLMLPGSPLIYYGDEIGMTDGQKVNKTVSDNDPVTEMMTLDKELTRSPMQWSPDAHAGFTDASSEPWIPVGINASTVNVQLQSQDNNSPLAFIEQTIRFRRNNSMLFGIYDSELFRFQTTYNEIVAFTREAPGSEVTTAVFAAINVAGYEVAENFEFRKERIPSTGIVVVATDQSRLGESINFSRILLRSGEAILVQYKPLAKPDAFSEPYEE